MELIAEIGQNHNGEMSLALELIHAAKENGADAVKFQVYNARELFTRENNEWYEYNCKTELTRDQLLLLADECRKSGIEFFASVFDAERIAWLEEVGVRRYKVASRSIHDEKLISALIRTGKQLLVSLGMWQGASFPVIPAQSVEFFYCVAKYPAELQDIHLSKVDFTRYRGFSDHSSGLTAACAALARGCQIIEKHFTLDKKMYGPDHLCSMTPQELHQLHRFREELSLCL